MKWYIKKGVKSLMNNTTIIVVGTILILAVLGAAFYYYRKQNLEKFYSEVFEAAKQVPKQKKNSFLLLMFKESLSASKNKKDATSFASKFNNKKYVEIQLIQMSNILKDTSKVEDKMIKRALDLLKSYQAWELAKIDNAKKATEAKAS